MFLESNGSATEIICFGVKFKHFKNKMKITNQIPAVKGTTFVYGTPRNEPNLK